MALYSSEWKREGYYLTNKKATSLLMWLDVIAIGLELFSLTLIFIALPFSVYKMARQ